MERRQNWVAITRHCLFDFMSGSPRLMQAEENGTRNGELLALVAHRDGHVSIAETGRRFWLPRERLRKIVGKGGSNARNSGGRRWHVCLQWCKPFGAWPSGMKRGQRVRSLQCANQTQQRLKVPRPTLRCELCGRTYTGKAFQLKHRTRFCSRTCQGRWVLCTLLRDTGRLRPVGVEYLVWPNTARG